MISVVVKFTHRAQWIIFIYAYITCHTILIPLVDPCDLFCGCWKCFKFELNCLNQSGSEKGMANENIGLLTGACINSMCACLSIKPLYPLYGIPTESILNTTPAFMHAHVSCRATCACAAKFSQSAFSRIFGHYALRLSRLWQCRVQRLRQDW